MLVFLSQVCPTVLQSPSEQWCVVAQLHRYPAPSIKAEQTPNGVASHPWSPSVQACPVGLRVVGAELGGNVNGADVGSVGVGKAVGLAVGAAVVDVPMVGSAVGGDVIHTQVWPAVTQSGAHWCVWTQLH